jgi:hypothetical protein
MVSAVTLAAMLVVGQAAPEGAKLADQVNRLVKQLDSGLAQREAAKKQLIALGPDVLELLPANHALANVRNDLAQVRKAIEEVLAVTTGKASEVTLEGKSLQLTDGLAALEKQTGNRVVDLRRPDEQSGDKTYDASLV